MELEVEKERKGIEGGGNESSREMAEEVTTSALAMAALAAISPAPAVACAA